MNMNYKEQISISVLCECSQREWYEGHQLAAAMNFKFPHFRRTPLSSIIPHASKDGIILLEALLHWNPAKRPTAQHSLRYLASDINHYYIYNKMKVL